MPLQKALEQLLDDTADVLVQAYARLRQAEDALAKANRENDRQRKQLGEVRQAMVGYRHRRA